MKKLLLLLLVASAVPGFSSSKSCSGDIHKLLIPGKPNIVQPKLGTFFECEKQYLPQLISILQKQPNSPDAYAAADVLQYLGNPEGMQAVDSWLQSQDESWIVSGPRPVPLRDADYAFIEKALAAPDSNNEARPILRSYVYALALDGSSKSVATLHRIRDYAAQRKDQELVERCDLLLSNQVKQVVAATTAAEAVQSNLFFYPLEAARKGAKIEVLAQNPDLALVSVSYVCGAMCSSQYHVVVRREQGGWRFQSVTLVAVS